MCIYIYVSYLSLLYVLLFVGVSQDMSSHITLSVLFFFFWSFTGQNLIYNITYIYINFGVTYNHICQSNTQSKKPEQNDITRYIHKSYMLIVTIYKCYMTYNHV